MLILYNRIMEQLSSHDIIQQYKEGRRDFSNVICSQAEFDNADLRGAIFRNVIMEGAGFKGADLKDCDFSGANLTWASFERAKLHRTNFTKANCSWSTFKDAKLDNTKFNNADLSRTLFVGVEWFRGDFTGADTFKCTKSFSDMTEVDRMELEKALESSGMPFSLKQEIQRELNRVANMWHKAVGFIKGAVGSMFSYGQPKKSQTSSIRGVYSFEEDEGSAVRGTYGGGWGSGEPGTYTSSSGGGGGEVGSYMSGASSEKKKKSWW